MAGVFLFLGIDEGSQIHEKFMLFTLRLMHHGNDTGSDFGWFYYAWVVPYGLFMVGLGFLILKWFLRLPTWLRKGFVLSGCVYVFGAVFLEMAGGKLAQTLPFKDPSFIWPLSASENNEKINACAPMTAISIMVAAMHPKSSRLLIVSVRKNFLSTNGSRRSRSYTCFPTW